MSNLIVIDDSNAKDFLNDPSVSQAGGMGLVPRDFTTHPVGTYGAQPTGDFLIPEAEFAERIREQEANRSSLEHKGNYFKVDALDQNGQGYCWAYSTTMAVTLIGVEAGIPYEPLSGHMIGCLVKGYRDEGGWNGESLEFVKKNGVASQRFWKQDSMSRSNDTPEMRADAKTRIVTEWWDLSDDSDTVQHQLASLLLQNEPVMIDLNWWGHSVCAVRLISWRPFTVRIRNSWGNSWSNNGYGDLVGNKAIPDGAACPLVRKAA